MTKKIPAKAQPRSGTASFKKIAEILKTGTWVFPNDGKYNGSGGPGRLLEDLKMRNIKEGNLVTAYWTSGGAQIKGMVEHTPANVGDLWYIRTNGGDLHAINPVCADFDRIELNRVDDKPILPNELKEEEGANESFERAAAAFYKATGMLMPGKDIAAGEGWTEEREEERRRLFKVWCAAIDYMRDRKI